MKPIFFCLAAVVTSISGAALAAAPGAPAREIPGAKLMNPAPQVDPLAAAKFLGTAYKKETDGFRVTPPAGSRLISRQGVDLVSFVVDSKSWGGSLQRIAVEKPTVIDPKTGKAVIDNNAPAMTLDGFIATTKAEITRDPRVMPKDPAQANQVNIFKGVQILEDKRLKWGKYDAARFSFSAQVELGPMVAQGVAEKLGLAVPKGTETVSLLRQELVVCIRDGLFYVLLLYTPLSDREVAQKTWDLMLPEFEIFDASAVVKRRNEAAKAGREWLAKRSAEELRGKMAPEKQFFRITVGGNDVGFFNFEEVTREAGAGGAIVDATRDGHRGVLVKVNLISFSDDGAVNLGQNEAFWSYAKDARGEAIPSYSSWINTSETKTKIVSGTRAGATAVQQVTPWLQETGILTQTGLPGARVPYQINVSLAGDRGQRVSAGVNTLIPLEAAPPLPKVLEYTWTRFVDLDTPSEMTFTAFDSRLRKMSTRNLIVTGKKENVNIDGKVEACYKCIDEIDPNSTTLWVDSNGRIRSMVTSDQSVMIPTTSEAMNTRWARQLAAVPR
jgi:hypothetical protein